ncbi:MAG: hypothetical protein ABIN91_20855 [Mucilaginibacter sp.]|uniref:hypothetical protein n=1 Tax=Mucilaginibacter sp. TaxID=1882438 RepID=UPI003265109B
MGGVILSCFDDYIPNIPLEISDLYPIISNKNRWKEAHNQFTQIRLFLLAHPSFKPEAYLLLAETAAKITYNASNEPAPFDADRGYWIPKLAMQAAEYFKDERLKEQLTSTILLFKKNKKFKESLIAAKDFLLYKKIDAILWYDWDPIGINDDFPRDEYQSYVPGAYNLKKAGTGKEEIAAYLLNIETERMGMNGGLDNCLKIAEKIINL